MNGRILGAVIDGLLGFVFLVLGWLVWRKEKISLFNGFNVRNVSPEDRKAFCTLSGIGLMLTGLGLLITAVLLALTDSALSFLAFAVGFALGLGLLITAGARYDHR